MMCLCVMLCSHSASEGIIPDEIPVHSFHLTVRMPGIIK